MSEEIKELDMNKYLVLKWEDINRLPYYAKEHANNLNLTVKAKRELEGKPQNQYLVLNLEDDIDWGYLTNWRNVVHPDYRKLKVKDIAVALVNAILKAKGD